MVTAKELSAAVNMLNAPSRPLAPVGGYRKDIDGLAYLYDHNGCLGAVCSIDMVDALSEEVLHRGGTPTPKSE